MRTSIIATALIALTACAHQPLRPLEGVTISLEDGCFPEATPLVKLRISNGSSTRIAFPTYGESGPPFKLHPYALQLLSSPTDAPWHPTPWQPVLEELMPANHQVSLGPGDETTFTVEPSLWPSSQEPGVFRLEVHDTLRRHYYSAVQPMCHTGSVPNKSFKPNPLRGSA
jgi:hypothetical protein